MHSISENVAINHTLPELYSFDYILCGQYGSHFNHDDASDPKGTKFCEITQYNGHYTVQCHSWPSFSVPIGKPVWIFLSCTVYRDTTDYLGNFRCRQGCASLYRTYWEWDQNSGLWNIA